MKKGTVFMKLTSVLAVVLFLGGTIVSCGAGGDGSGQLSFQDPEEVEAVEGAVSLSIVLSETASGLAGDSVNTYYAPGARKRRTSDDIAKLDPRLKELYDRMVEQLQSPALTSTVKKARELTASLAVPVDPVPCQHSGDVTITGTETTDGIFNEASITLQFNACKDDVLRTELSGEIVLYEKSAIDGSSFEGTMSANNFTSKQYDKGELTPFLTLDYTDVLNTTFATNWTDDASTVTGTASINGSFTETFSGGLEWAINFNNINETLSRTINTNTFTLSGGFVFSVSDGIDSQSFNITYSNFENKWKTNLDGSEDNWINGSISLNWSPAVPGCLAGTITFTTADSTPMHYVDADATCPSSGTVHLNNATIEFGKPSGTSVTITVGSLSAYYATCEDMGGGSICVM